MSAAGLLSSAEDVWSYIDNMPKEKIMDDRKPATDGNSGFINPYNFVRWASESVYRYIPPTHEKFSGLSGGITIKLKNVTPMFLPDPEGTKKFEIKKDGRNNEYIERQDKTFMRSLQRQLFDTRIELKKELDKIENGRINNTVKKTFSSKGIQLSEAAQMTMQKVDHKWRIEDNNETYLIRNVGEKLEVYEEKPYIPGSSLKGMIRNVAEAVSNSCYSIFTNELAIFRDNRSRSNRKIGYIHKEKDGSLSFDDMSTSRRKVDASDPVLRKGLFGDCVTESGSKCFDTYQMPIENNPNFTARMPEMVSSIYKALPEKLKREPMKDDKCTPCIDKPYFPSPETKKWLRNYISLKDNPTYIWGHSEGQDKLLFKIDANHEADLDGRKNTTSKLNLAFKENGILLSRYSQVSVEKRGNSWRINNNKNNFIAKKQGDYINIYLIGNPTLIDFGRNFYYKWAYDPVKSLPQDLHPCNKEDNKLCTCCSIFGMVEQKEQGEKAFAGRVSVGPAKWVSGNCEFKTVKDHKILGSPKHSCRSFYLEPSPLNKENFNVAEDNFLCIDEDGQITPNNIRGRKFYWHHAKRWDQIDWFEEVKRKKYNNKCPEPTNQNARIQALNSDNSFEFQIDFDNLMDWELGLLLWTIELPNVPDGAHHLGLGKPLGLGSVVLEVAEMQIIDRNVRYNQLFDTGVKCLDKDPYIKAFREKIEEINGGISFNELTNVCDLKTILSRQFPQDENVEICYPPGKEEANRRTPDNVHPSELNYEWFSQIMKWSEPLLSIQDIANGEYQNKDKGE
ncbi:TIGR03986 family CRISPR-associated RAMP protein [Candidatus Poribacteria bacterium]|nr:TIGR03986 family CRISPR-associated RAMP protein [Candidatus Poribacteria bacterium]